MTASCVKVSTCKMLGTVAGLHTYLFNLHHNIDPGGLDAVSSRSKSQSKCDHLPHAHAPLSVVHPLYLSS